MEAVKVDLIVDGLLEIGIDFGGLPVSNSQSIRALPLSEGAAAMLPLLYDDSSL